MANRVGNCPFSERRVRPIYDLLDNGNNKKALQEAEKVLKKQPNSTCAKALKSLALLRLGRETESLDLLEAIKSESPVDEMTLQAVTVCYRDCNRPQAICEVYEKASAKEPGNEDILINLFFAYVRVGDYARQRLTAMALYKIRPKNQYYFWACISTLLQTIDNVEDLIQLCTIPANRRVTVNLSLTEKGKNDINLVHRLLEKFVNEDKIESEQEVLTYILVLEMMGKHEEALSTLNGPLGVKLEPFTLLNKKLDLLVKLKLWNQVHSLLEDMLFEEPDCWHCYTLYIESVFEIAGDKYVDFKSDDSPFVKAKKFLDAIIATQESLQFKKRGPYLARLEFYSALLAKNLPVEEMYGKLVPLLQQYFQEFGSKECCVHDLRKYVHLCGGNDVVEFMAFASKGMGPDKIPENKTQLNLLVSNGALVRMMGLKSWFFGVNDKRKFVLNEVNRYIGSLPLCADAAPTDAKACDDLALFAVRSLFELWTDTEDGHYLFEAIVLCEFALSNSPNNSQLKILLLKFYHLLGASESAQMTYIALDLKHMQLDTLGYLHLFPLLTNGSYVHASHVLNTSTKFFTNNSKESADHVVFAYKYEALSKIPEFIGIREKMMNSTHYVLATTERMLCEMFAASNNASAIQIAKEMEISLNLERIKWSELRDNRDFTVLWDVEAPDRWLTEECVVQSHHHDLVFLRLRSLLLHCIVSCLDIGKVNLVAGQTDSPYAQVRGQLADRIIQMEETVKPVKNNIPSSVSKRFIAGPPVSRLLLMLQINYFDLILIELRLLSSCLMPFEDGVRDKCQYQLDVMVLFLEELLRYVKTVAGSSQIQVRNTFVQVVALFVELISFSCLVAGVCEIVLSKTKQNIFKKNKKKNQNQHRVVDASLESEWRLTLLNKFVTVLVETVDDLEQILKSEEKLWAEKKNPFFETLITSNVDSKEERNKLSSVSAMTIESLYHSYMANITQMTTVLKTKSKYLSSLKL